MRLRNGEAAGNRASLGFEGENPFGLPGLLRGIRSAFQVIARNCTTSVSDFQVRRTIGQRHGTYAVCMYVM